MADGSQSRALPILFMLAAETDAADVADSAGDVNLARSPGLQAGDVSLVDNRSVTNSFHRHDHLSPMRVPGEHQVPRKRIELVLAVWIMR